MDKFLTPCGKECEHLVNVTTRLGQGDALLKQIVAKLDKLDEKVSSTNDIVQAWNEVKGFVSTVKNISAFLKVMAPIAALFAGMAWAMRRAGLL